MKLANEDIKLLESVLDFLYDHEAEIRWYKNEPRDELQNEYFELENVIEKFEQLIDKLKNAKSGNYLKEVLVSAYIVYDMNTGGYIKGDNGSFAIFETPDEAKFWAKQQSDNSNKHFGVIDCLLYQRIKNNEDCGIKQYIVINTKTNQPYTMDIFKCEYPVFIVGDLKNIIQQILTELSIVGVDVDSLKIEKLETPKT